MKDLEVKSLAGMFAEKLYDMRLRIHCNISKT